MKTSSATVTLLIPLVCLVGCATPQVEQAPVAAHKPRPMQMLSQPTELESEYGVQVAQVGLSASGGLVDLRLRVLDTVKARALLGNPANAPTLVSGDKPPLMPPHHALQGAKFGQGQLLYVLYPNSRGAVQPGTTVTVAMGQLRFGPVWVQ